MKAVSPNTYLDFWLVTVRESLELLHILWIGRRHVVESAQERTIDSELVISYFLGFLILVSESLAI